MATAKRARTAKSAKVAKPSVEEPVKFSPPAVNLQEAIQLRAYELYTQRGGQHGRALEDWLLAEVELSAGNGRKSA